jgi:prepilin-type N-terminal cleavage/methylation domain-containing protein
MSSPFSRSSGSITRRRPQAFTLVELMVIVAVIGIVSGVAITGMATFLQEQKLRQATAELASYLQSARARAQREGGFCQLAVSGTQIAPTTATGNVCNNAPVQPSLDLAAVSAASGLAVTASPSTPITFTRLGTLATATMPRMITLSYSANRPTMRTCVFLDLVGIRTGWRRDASGTCTYTNG